MAKKLPPTTENPHYPSCPCNYCMPFEGRCPECDEFFSSWEGYSRHILFHKPKRGKFAKKKRSDIGKKRYVLVPDGLGGLVKTLSSTPLLQAKNIAAVSRFSEALNNGTISRFTRPQLNAMKRLEESTTNYMHQISTNIPKTQALAAYKIAQAANVNLHDVIALLIAYGLEHLAQDPPPLPPLHPPAHFRFLSPFL